ncbi:bicyclomycin/multidrug efflux system [Salmonella enterica subsp. arizonae]|nr:hypothetical protein SED60170_01612 [Salmonella enterica subsp. diarizonae serovar 60:r:e,n,x,z15 str. 01-0170]SUG60210.1 bicyclomycin/multidrug efflux system [Salmonella enterica subsp. arizonae]
MIVILVVLFISLVNAIGTNSLSLLLQQRGKQAGSASALAISLQFGMGAFLVGLHERLLQGGTHHRLVGPADAAQHVAHEVNPAALPAGREHLLYRSDHCASRR